MKDTFTLQDIADNFQIGERFTYREFTTRLDIRYYSGGNSKEAQLKLLKRCAKIRKDGRYYTITEIFDEIKPDERQTRSDAIYEPLIVPLLATILKGSGNYSSACPFRQWYARLGMVNQNYIQDAGSPQKRHSQDVPVSVLAFGTDKLKERFASYNYDIFFIYTSQKFKQTLISVLRKSSRNQILAFNQRIIVVTNENEQDDHSDNDSLFQQREATQEESTFIRNTRNSVCQEMGYDDISSLQWKGRAILNKFYAICNRRTKERFPYIVKVWEELEITFDKRHIDMYILDNDRFKEARQQLNEQCAAWTLIKADSLSGNRYTKKEYDIGMQESLCDFYIREK